MQQLTNSKLLRTWKSVWPVFNELLLTPYKEPAFDSQRHPPPPPPEIIEDQEEYEVNKIHDSKLVCGKLRYLLEWFGYPERHNMNGHERQKCTTKS